MGAPVQQAYFVVLSVVADEGRYLMIRETKHGQRWYLPGGGVEDGESPRDGAKRETLEEAGIEIEPFAYASISATKSAFVGQPSMLARLAKRLQSCGSRLRRTYSGMASSNGRSLP